jgi:hypothetical protein
LPYRAGALCAAKSTDVVPWLQDVMASVFDTLSGWARKTTSSFAELRNLGDRESNASRHEGDGLIYRLKVWPDLPSSSKTADVYRTLSVMSNRPVNRHWILSSSRMQAAQVDALLRRLVADGAVEVIDASKFPASHHPA